MAVIPLQVASRSLDTGGTVQYPTSTPVADAFSNLGKTLQGVAQRVQEKQDQHDSFLSQIEQQKFTADLGGVEDQAIENAPADASGLHDSVYGQIDPRTGAPVKPGSFDKLFDSYLAKVPESKRAEFIAKKEVFRAQGSARLARSQYLGEQEYYKVEIGKSQNDLMNAMLQADPNDTKTFEQFKQQQLDLIDKSGLPQLDKEVAKTNWLANADETLFKAKLEKDPEFAGKARAALGLGQTAVAGPAGAVGTVVDHIIGVESGGNANAKNPTSSASGLGQFLDSTWLNTIKQHRPDLWNAKSRGELLALKSDPTLGREMTTAYTQDNAEFLQNKGIQLTPGNIYLAHFLGPQGAANLLKADPGASVVSVVGQDVVRANSFLAGKSVADTVAWAAKKMGGKAAGADPAFANIPADRRLALANAADSTLRDRQAQNRTVIETAIQNAPAAIQNTGNYDGQLPGPQDFNNAYGPQEGAQRYNQFQAAVETSQQAYAMQTMPTAEVNALVQKAVPTSSGDTAALDQKRYATLADAAAQTLKAREADPATYVRQAFPNVERAWNGVPQGGDISGALAATAAAERQLGIQKMRLLPDQIATDATAKFKDATQTERDRLTTATSLIFSSNDPEQRKAIFDQLVDAGLPDITEGAVRALERGDTGAGRRLFQAAMVDPSKLPGQSPFKPAEIDEAVQSNVMDQGQVGDLFYGLSDGSTSNFTTAERDSKLMTNAVNIRTRNGETLDAAIAGASKDLFGDVQAVNDTHAQILLPAGDDPQPVLAGLESVLPRVRTAMEQALTVDATGTEKAVTGAVASNYIAQVMSEGYFRNSQGGYVFIDPYSGAAIADQGGKPIVFTDKDFAKPDPVDVPVDQPLSPTGDFMGEMRKQYP